VSKKTTEMMASSVRKLTGADFGVGITGFAGPGGGTKDNPVGRVFISGKTKNRMISKKYIFQGSRQEIKKKAVLKTLRILKGLLL
ncbi:MAG: CinA family protein, partial [Candidatus Omnitrophica bacterium]|nr:CinA family protein [Candidatus Omnitrophota bacterium]